MSNKKSKKELRNEILELVGQYCDDYLNAEKEFEPGDKIPYASRVFNSDELQCLVDSSLDFWLTADRYAAQFEKNLADFLGIEYALAVNSGSSANLLAFMALTSPLLKERMIKRGDEVITVAAGFPTTVTPIIQYGAVPVFVDVKIPDYCIDITKLEQALSNKTKAVMLAHTLGNPFDLKYVKEFCKKHNLWLIEDNCDALGSKYIIDGEEKYTGTIGDIGTSSFYPAHHITMGEGGAVYTNDPLLKKIAMSMRDWGRDCICTSGHDNMCGHRFDGKHGKLPFGYDHKYVYSHFGYNLKVTEMQAAIGVAQLKKLPDIIKRRRENFDLLYSGLSRYKDKIILPEATKNSIPSWFGFLITCKAGIDRVKVTTALEKASIQTRTLFAGNLLLHPCFDEMRENNEGYRIAGELHSTNDIMNNSFWIGVYSGMTEKKINYMVEQIGKAIF